MVAISVVLIMVGLLLLDLFVQFAENWFRRGYGSSAPDGRPLAGSEAPPGFPPGLFFDVGLDGDIASLLGQVDDIGLPEPGTTVQAGEPLATLRQGSHVLTVRSPVEGKVDGVNAALTGAMLIASPYERGWLCTISPVALARDARRLVVGEEARDWRRIEAEGLREFLSSAGSVAEHPPTLATLSDAQRAEFQRRFLDATLATA
jgi:glycine cleavage system H lipoate-binding protein